MCVMLLSKNNPSNLIVLLVIVLQFASHSPYFVQTATLARLQSGGRAVTENLTSLFAFEANSHKIEIINGEPQNLSFLHSDAHTHKCSSTCVRKLADALLRHHMTAEKCSKASGG